MKSKMEFNIKPFHKKQDTLLGINLFFSLLNDSDLRELNETILSISKSGLARTKFVAIYDGKRAAYKIHFVPKLNEKIQVTEIHVRLESISIQRFQNYQKNLEKIRTQKEFKHIQATALLDSNLNLINFFNKNSLSFEKIIENKTGKTEFTNWVKLLFAGKGDAEIHLSAQLTGSTSLKISFSGFNTEKSMICLTIESEDYKDNNSNQVKGLQFNMNILNSIPADIVFWNMDHQYIFLNENAMKNADLRKWIIGKNDFEFFQYRNKPVEMALKRRETFNRVITSGEPAYLEEHFKTSNGDFHHLRILQPMTDFEDHIEWVLGYSIDISSIKRIESRLLKMNLAVEEAMDGIAVLNEKSEYVYVNEAHVKMFGYTNPEDFLGNTWHMLYEKEEISRIENNIFPLIAKNGRWAGETKGKSKDGKTLYQEITLTSLPDRGLVCICRDKTEYRENKDRIQTAEIIADNINSIIMITDPNLKIQWVNNAFEHITGYTLNEVIGKHPVFLHGPKTDKEAVKAFSKKLKQGNPCSAELLNYAKDGSKYWIQINVTPLYDENNKLKSFISVENDVTELKNAEINTRNALSKEKDLNELKSQFVSIASHEIRTPLASIQSSSDLIQMFISSENVPKDKIKKHLEKISGQIFRLSSIMSNLLTIGKINLDKFSLNKNEVDIENFISKIINDFFGINADGRTIRFKATGTKRKSDIDQVLMSQVLTNLIGNALKYSKDKAEPEVLLEYLPENFKISIKDYGIGIPQDQIPYIYDSFFRARNVENIQGTGLGMVIVKKFVEMHKGNIEVNSIENEGTTFTITFPYT